MKPSSAHRVFVPRRIPEAGIEILRREGLEVSVAQHDDEVSVPREPFLEGLRRCDVLLPLLSERLDEGALASAPDLLGIAQMAVGFDNIDLPAATRLGIPVSNTPGVLTETTADFTWALLLAVARRIPEAHHYVASDRFRLWGPNLLLGGDVGPGPEGVPKVLGIVGYGRIGRAVARRASGFGMEILAHTSNRRLFEEEPSPIGVRWAELDELLARSDFVSLHVPLNARTRHLIGEAELRRMLPTAYLINTARGPVVDESALVRALAEGWIAGAALDVFEREPALAPGLAELPNVVLAPHIASASHATRSRMATLAALDALAHLHGEPAAHPINPEVYDTEAYRLRRQRAGLGAPRSGPPE